MRSVSLGGAVERRAGVHPPLSLSGTRLRVLATGALLSGLFVLVRLPLALTSMLSETYYDEALTGLMAMEILPPGPDPLGPDRDRPLCRLSA